MSMHYSTFEFELYHCLLTRSAVSVLYSIQLCNISTLLFFYVKSRCRNVLSENFYPIKLNSAREYHVTFSKIF